MGAPSAVPDHDRISVSPPLSETRLVKASRRDIPHAVIYVVIDETRGLVNFVGPCLHGQSEQYEADLGAHGGDVDKAIRAALEERMYGPDAPCSVDPEDARFAA